MNISQRCAAHLRSLPRGSALLGGLLGLTLAILLATSASPAFAGQASTGELLFYPCTTCHPVGLRSDGPAGRKLPNDFKGHQIVLVMHDRLGKGRAACLVCHDDAFKNPGKLKLMDGSLIDITGDVSQVCYRCHSAKYNEWKVGAHGKRKPKCTSAGCHDPHTPSWIYSDAVRPFSGTGFQTRAVSQRTPFVPLASKPIPPATLTPGWLKLGTSLGSVLALGIIGVLLVGRPKR